MKRISLTSSKHLRFEIDLQKFNNSENNQLENIVVRISDPNKRPENLPSLLLTAHYDSGKLISKLMKENCLFLF
jgi:acetylornithine deacetylase/succinyl-diaminopimelate desuccinylase-like protein